MIIPSSEDLMVFKLCFGKYETRQVCKPGSYRETISINEVIRLFKCITAHLNN